MADVRRWTTLERLWARVGVPLLVALLACVATTAIRIEILNRAAGGVLPKREMRTEGGGREKWRQALWTNEKRWRQMLGPRDEDGQPVTRPLTAAEQQQMQADMRDARTDNALRDVVSTWGLWQYLFVPALLVMGAVVMLGGRGWPLRGLGAAGMLVALAAGWLMIQREYFASLGW